MGGHNFKRTHRGKERFPGMTITYGLMEAYEAVCKSHPERARLLTKSTVNKLLKDEKTGGVVGIEYTNAKKETLREYGSVIICCGGYGADYSENSYLRQYRPDICHLPTTNGDHCNGSGLRMA